MMGTYKKFFLTALASLLMAGHAFAQAPVFITAGQSNADGCEFRSKMTASSLF